MVVSKWYRNNIKAELLLTASEVAMDAANKYLLCAVHSRSVVSLSAWTHTRRLAGVR